MTTALEVLVTTLPGGTLTVVAADGVVVSSGYDDDVLARIPAPLRPRGTRDVDRIAGVSEAIDAYVDGDGGALDRVPVQQAGGEFYQAAWQAMRQIPPGGDLELRRARRQGGTAECDQGGRLGVCPQQRRAVRALPPGAALRRQPGRLRVRSPGQARPAGPRAGQPLTQRGQSEPGCSMSCAT